MVLVMRQEPRTFRFSGRRAALAAACVGTTMLLSGCNAAGGALMGYWFGAAIGGSGDAALAGALLGAGIGGVIGAGMEHDYPTAAPREWYRPCRCNVCRGGHSYNY